MGLYFEKMNNMKTLKVIEPFFNLGLDDTFELSKDGKNYVAERVEEYNKQGAFGEELKSSFSSSFSISPDYAKELIKEGYLEEVKEGSAQPDKEFVNVFDEIDELLNGYKYRLDNIDKDLPEVLKLEETTVLSNLVKVLTHLKNLKK